MSLSVALCLSGQPRHFETTYKSIYSNLIELYKADVFLHSWYDPSMVWQNFECSGWNIDNVDCVRPYTDKKLIDLYKPKLYLIEKPITFNVDHNLYDKKRCGPLSINSAFSMWYSIKEANKLKQQYEIANNMKYDCVVRCRYDLLFRSPVKYEDENLNFVICPAWYGPTKKDQKIISDHFGFSKSENMDIYCSVYDNIKLYVTEHNVNFVNERMLQHHLKMNNIEYYKKKCEYSVVRGKGTKKTITIPL